jgi:hypothetical protein
MRLPPGHYAARMKLALAQAIEFFAVANGQMLTAERSGSFGCGRCNTAIRGGITGAWCGEVSLDEFIGKIISKSRIMHYR